MTLKEKLQNYYFDHIPLSKALSIVVEECNFERVAISAPLLANINHKKTAFGGSLHNVSTFACWGILWLHIKELEKETGKNFEIVIFRSEVDYLLPVQSDFIAESRLSSEDDIFKSFKKTLLEKGKSRIKLSSEILEDHKIAVRYSGIFVAIELGKIAKNN